MLKKLALAFVLLLLVGAGVGLWAWRKATALPDWYEGQAEAVATPQIVVPPPAAAPPARRPARDFPVAPGFRGAPAPPARAAAPTATRQPLRRELSGPELDALLRQIVRETLGGGPDLTKMIRGSRTQIEDGSLDLQVVVNTGALPAGALPPAHAEGLRRALEAFPFLEGRDVLVGVRGPVAIEDGRLRLPPGTEIRVGDLALGFDEVVRRLRIPPEQLEGRLRLRWGGRRVTGLRLEGERAILTGE